MKRALSKTEKMLKTKWGVRRGMPTVNTILPQRPRACCSLLSSITKATWYQVSHKCFLYRIITIADIFWVLALSPCTVLDTSHTVTHLILTSTLWKLKILFHVTDEETESQRGDRTCLCHRDSQWRSVIWTQVVAELASRVFALKHSTIKCGAYLKKDIREKESERETRIREKDSDWDRERNKWEKAGSQRHRNLCTSSPVCYLLCQSLS